jgi:transglutaminase-like putative cysteine protease
MRYSIEKHHASNRFPFNHIAVYGILSLMLIMGTANFASIEFDAVSVQSINDKIIGIFPSLGEWRHDGGNKGVQSGFTFEETHYQENNEKLGGAIQEDKSIVMYVSADSQLYLRGRIKSLYTGENWLAAQDKGTTFVQDDQGKEYKGITYKETKIEVYPTNIRTNTIFAPYKPYRVDVEGYEVLRTKEDELYIVKSFLRPRPKFYYVHSKVPMLNEVDFTGNSKSYKAEMREYLQLPDEMSPKIKALTEEVTDGYSNSYEKIKGIETYLRKTYPYALYVRDVPEHKDFVEFFLYEEKKGYCTYFASAMAVMGRTIGVPTRYVEGFILPDVKNEDGYFEVTADRAHAWVEAYFDELGWIAFEPTPAYRVQSDEIHIESHQGVNTNTISSPQRQNPDYLAFKNRLEEEFSRLSVNGDYNGEKPLHPMEIPNVVLKMMMGIINIFILAILLRISYCKIKMYRLYLMKQNPRAVGYYYESIEALSKHLESNEEEGLTPRERLKRVEKYFSGNLNRDEIAQIFEKGLYSGKDLSLEELKKVKDFEKKMEEVVKHKLGIRIFLYLKYIKGSLYAFEPEKSF